MRRLHRHAIATVTLLGSLLVSGASAWPTDGLVVTSVETNPATVTNGGGLRLPDGSRKFRLRIEPGDEHKPTWFQDGKPFRLVTYSVTSKPAETGVLTEADGSPRMIESCTLVVRYGEDVLTLQPGRPVAFTARTAELLSKQDGRTFRVGLGDTFDFGDKTYEVLAIDPRQLRVLIREPEGQWTTFKWIERDDEAAEQRRP